MQIRAALVSDLGAILALEERSFREPYPRLVPRQHLELVGPFALVAESENPPGCSGTRWPIAHTMSAWLGFSARRRIRRFGERVSPPRSARRCLSVCPRPEWSACG